MISTYTFWRFLLNIPLADSEMKVQYSINGGPEMDFFVPGHHQTMRLAAYSVSACRRSCHCTLSFLTKSSTQCNGFSANVNSDDFRGPGFQSGYDPVWVDLLAKHAEQPYHLLVGGGDQIYSDSCVIWPNLCVFGVRIVFQSRSGTRIARMAKAQKIGEDELSPDGGDRVCNRPLLLQPLLPIVSERSVRSRK